MYQVTGNPLILPWLVFVTTPLYNMFILDDQTNVAKKVEKKFENCKLFLLPLYTLQFSFALYWIWGLLLLSDNYKEYWWLRHRPANYFEGVAFFGVMTFFSS